MAFYTLTQQKMYNTIADAIVGREQEVFLYDLNINNYNTMLTNLPQDDWPEHLVQYKNSTPENIPDEYDQIVADYQYRDRLRYLLKTERIERSKSFRVYESLLSQLPADERDALIAAAVQRLQG